MGRYTITILLAVCLLWLSGCSYNPYNSLNPPTKPSNDAVKLGSGVYYPRFCYRLPKFKASFNNTIKFNTSSLPTRVNALYFGCNNVNTDQPQLDQLLSGLSETKSTLWVFNAYGSTLPKKQNRCTVYQLADTLNLPARLNVKTYPTTMLVDGALKEYRWITQGNNPELAKDLKEALKLLQHKKSTLQTVWSVTKFLGTFLLVATTLTIIKIAIFGFHLDIGMDF